MTDIVISEEKLRKVNSIKEDKAKEIVKSTRATVNGKQAKVTRHQNSITVSLAPEAVKAFEDDFVDGLWIIQLITDKDEMVFFGYDSDSETLLPKKEEEKATR